MLRLATQQLLTTPMLTPLLVASADYAAAHNATDCDTIAGNATAGNATTAYKRHHGDLATLLVSRCYWYATDSHATGDDTTVVNATGVYSTLP